MKKITLLSTVSAVTGSLVIVAAYSLSSVPAAADVLKGGYAGKTGEEITKSLEEEGYEVRKIETEDGYLEAYALLNGERFEIYVDPETGKIMKVEQDD